MSHESLPGIPWFVGAYAALPGGAWDRDTEQRLLEEFSSVKEFTGWEAPFGGALHPYDEDWYLRQLGAGIELMVTLIPRVVGALRFDPAFGLASEDEDGRRRAVALVAEALAAAHRAEQLRGRRVVRAIELHSSPRGISSADCFRNSLREIASWEWGGAHLLIEHCDAAIPDQQPSRDSYLLRKNSKRSLRWANSRPPRSAASSTGVGPPSKDGTL